MITRHFNGEYWYEKNESLLTRVKKWFWWQPYKSDTPISLFGHRITFQWFGMNVNLGRTYLCATWRNNVTEKPKLSKIYLSPNATPWAATDWLYGAPHDVAKMAKRKQGPDAERLSKGILDQAPYES